MGSKKRVERIDKKHRFPLRIWETAHHEADALAFRHNVSLNVIYCEAILYALNSDHFREHVRNKFPRDERRGHFVYHANTQTQRMGRKIDDDEIY